MKSSCLVVAVGDLVQVEFDAPTRIHIINVSEVERRYGKVNQGTISQNPLIVGTDINSGERKIFDASFVKKILKRSNSKVVFPKKNIFVEESILIKKKGSTWFGSLRSLAVAALARLPYELDRPLHEERLRTHYLKSGLGCSNYDWPMTVNKHRFCRWVAKNYTRIVMTSAEHEQEMTEYHMDCEKQLEADMERFFQEEEESFFESVR